MLRFTFVAGFVWINSQFSPTSRLKCYSTPPLCKHTYLDLTCPLAREASKRIVEDLLLTAGGNVTDDVDEDSPSVIKRGGLLDEDTF